MGKIIVIDGTSNAGKTTLCENIEKNIRNIAIIPGASLFAKMHQEKYPQIPEIPKNEDEEKENQEFFFKLELDRLIEANKLARQGKDVFMDRGIFEILSVAYSFESIKKWNGIYKNAENLYNKFITITSRNKIKLPDRYILLQANSDEILRRNESRKIDRGQKLSENEWIEINLINKQIEFFNKLCVPENENKIYLVDTSNMTRQNVYERVCHLLKLRIKEMERNDD